MRNFLLCLFAVMTSAAYAQTTFDPADYCLTWSDEFDVNGLPNQNNWRYETGYSIRNNEAQNYTANRLENARVENGNLIIEARRDNYQGYEISSASLVSWGKVVHRYGRFECRAKIDIRSGSWPAFWTLGERMEWPSNGEIDIMEYYQGKLLGNAAWGTETRWQGNWDSQYLLVSSFPDGWENEFHVFMMEWTPDYIRLYVDDILINAVDLSTTFNGSLGNYENPFRQPHYLILNQAIGGNNGGDYSNTQFPIRYEIDYVRIYQLATCNESLDCNWEEGGSAYLDDCQICVGGNSGREACTLTCEGNMVLNPGLENSGLASWTGWGDRWESQEAFTGSTAVAVGNGAAEQVITVKPNTPYKLTAIAKKAGGGAVFLGVKEHGYAEKNIRIDNNTWQTKTLEFTTGNTTIARIYYYNPEGGTAYGDDFYMEQKGCDVITSTKTAKTSEEAYISPNPSDESFTLNETSGLVEINSFTGQLISTETIVPGKKYGTDLPAGNYFIYIKSENMTKRAKWIKY